MYNPSVPINRHFASNSTISQIKRNISQPRVTFTHQSQPKSYYLSLNHPENQNQQLLNPPRVDFTGSIYTNQQNISVQYLKPNYQGVLSLSAAAQNRYINPATNEVNISGPFNYQGTQNGFYGSQGDQSHLNQMINVTSSLYPSSVQQHQHYIFVQSQQKPISHISSNNQYQNQLQQQIDFLRTQNARKDRQITELTQTSDQRSKILLKQKFRVQNQTINFLEKKMLELQYRYSDIEELKNKLVFYQDVIKQQRKLIDAIDDSDRRNNYKRVNSLQQNSSRKNLQQMYKNDLYPAV